jgi:hypothetical protein
MAKLGYTWYPKDWGNSESVFELNLSERGLYRELIDLAMLNDNKTEIKLDVWSRKFAIDSDALKLILSKLLLLNLIQINKGSNSEILFIPSCESRLKLVRGGRNGGKISKPTIKPIVKPFESLEQKNEKPIANQIEKEIESKHNNNDLYFNELINSESWLETCAMQNQPKFNIEEIKDNLLIFKNDLNLKLDIKQQKKEFTTHFVRWLNQQTKNNNNSKKYDIDEMRKQFPDL